MDRRPGSRYTNQPNLLLQGQRYTKFDTLQHPDNFFFEVLKFSFLRVEWANSLILEAP